MKDEKEEAMLRSREGLFSQAKRIVPACTIFEVVEKRRGQYGGGGMERVVRNEIIKMVRGIF